MFRELRYAVRTLRQSPGFTIVAVASLALGIGANTAVFSLLDRALLRSMQVREPERMVVFHVDSLNLRGTASSDNYETVYSLDMLRDFRKQTDVFEVLRCAGCPRGDWTHLLEEDDRAPGERPVAVLPHSAWIQKFGGDPGVIGRQVRLNGNPFTIVGVLGAGFHTAVRGDRPAVIVPVSM